MALDIWIGNPTRFAGGPAASFEPEAYYSFLLPLFEEFAESYGQMIDPYDGAAFESNALAPVLELIDKAQAFISAQPEEFAVYMGKNLGSYLDPKNEDIYQSVRRNEYLVFIHRVRLAVLEAQQTSQPLIFFGD